MKRPAGRGGLILYLDYDGVLHHENVLWHPSRGVYLDAPAQYVLFQHVDLLDAWLEPYPDVRLVLSTSWVRTFGFSRAARRLPPRLRARVIGATYHSQMNRQVFAAIPRGMQVWEDVQRRQPRDWLALDDDVEGWPDECRDKHIRTHLHEGLSAPDVSATFKAKLAELCSLKTPGAQHGHSTP